MGNPEHLRVLLIEDNQALAESLMGGLREAGYDTRSAASFRAAKEMLAEFTPDFALLDLGLPDADGTGLIPLLRELKPKPFVLITSARDTERDRILGLDAGADDYLTKPYSFAELLARLRALHRRRGPAPEPTDITVGCLRLDLLTRRVYCGGKQLEFTPREFGLLSVLARRAGEVIPREQLAEEVWQSPKRFTPIDNLIEVNISRLRNKLLDAGCTLRLNTVRGLGYQLEKPT